MTIAETVDELQITIRANRSYRWVLGRLGIICLLALFCCLALASVSGHYFTAFPARLAVWFIGIVPCILTFLFVAEAIFQLLGSETINCRAGLLRIETSLRPWRRTRVWNASEVRGVRLSEKIVKGKAGRRRICRRIAFELANQTVATRFNLSREEGELVHDSITRAFGMTTAVGARISSEPRDQVPGW